MTMETESDFSNGHGENDNFDHDHDTIFIIKNGHDQRVKIN
jgi:hypothetical protein